MLALENLFGSTHAQTKKCLVGSSIGFFRNKQPDYIEGALLVDLKDREQIVAQCSKLDCNVILPVELCEQHIIAKHATWLRQHSIQFLLSDWDTIATCHNKRNFALKLEALGFGDYIPRTLPTMHAPCIAKKVEDIWGQHSFAIATESDEHFARSQLSDVDFMIQEYISGDHEFVSHILAVDGDIQSIATFKNTHNQKFYVQGIRGRQISVDFVETPVPIRNVLESVLRALKYSGVCCIDYKIGSDGRPKIFEINPRLGATLALDRIRLSEMIRQYQDSATRMRSKMKRLVRSARRALIGA